MNSHDCEELTNRPPSTEELASIMADLMRTCNCEEMIYVDKEGNKVTMKAPEYEAVYIKKEQSPCK